MNRSSAVARARLDRYFGELGPMLNLPRSASARATEPTVLTGCTVQPFRTLHPSKAELGTGLTEGGDN